MSNDAFEDHRRQWAKEINSRVEPNTTKAIERARLEGLHGQVWDTDELNRDFEVKGFMAPLVVVERKSDGAHGTMLFQHEPRFYWGFAKD